MVRIRELRNLIAHEYATDKLHGFYQAIGALTPRLLQIVPKVQAYSVSLMAKYPSG